MAASTAAAAAAAPILNAPVVPIQWVKTLELSYCTDTAASAAAAQPAVCFGCGKEQQQAQAPSSSSSSVLLKCAKYKVAGYCSKECQVADWKKQHKLACGSYARLVVIVGAVGVAAATITTTAQLASESDGRDARNEIFGRIRFYACPYAVTKQSELGRGFLFIQSDQTLAVQSLAIPKDPVTGRSLGMRSVMVHFLTLGEFDQEVCREDFEMTSVRSELQQAVAVYNEELEVVVLMRFRCGHVALGTATLVPDYKVCRQLGREYFAQTNAGALQLNLDDI